MSYKTDNPKYAKLRTRLSKKYARFLGKNQAIDVKTAVNIFPKY